MITLVPPDHQALILEVGDPCPKGSTHQLSKRLAPASPLSPWKEGLLLRHAPVPSTPGAKSSWDVEPPFNLSTVLHDPELHLAFLSPGTCLPSVPLKPTCPATPNDDAQMHPPATSLAVFPPLVDKDLFLGVFLGSPALSSPPFLWAQD